jgi:hypothetical protein
MASIRKHIRIQEQPHEVKPEQIAQRQRARCPILLDADIAVGPAHSLHLPLQGGVRVGSRPCGRRARSVEVHRHRHELTCAGVVNLAEHRAKQIEEKMLSIIYSANRQYCCRIVLLILDIDRASTRDIEQHRSVDWE